VSRPQRILGIDPGLASLGWGVVDSNGRTLSCIDYGCIKTSTTDSLSKRLLTIHENLQALYQQFEPTVLAIEKLFFGKNAKTAMLVGEARGVIILSAAKSEIPIQEYTPAEIKIALTGYGNATKEQVQEMVKHSLKLDKIPRPNHAADALGVAITASVSNNLLMAHVSKL